MRECLGLGAVAALMVAFAFWCDSRSVLTAQEASAVCGGATDSEAKCEYKRWKVPCGTAPSCARSFDNKTQCDGNCNIVCNATTLYYTFSKGKGWKVYDGTTSFACGLIDNGNYNCALNAKKDACVCTGVANVGLFNCARAGNTNDPCS